MKIPFLVEGSVSSPSSFPVEDSVSSHPHHHWTPHILGFSNLPVVALPAAHFPPLALVYAMAQPFTLVATIWKGQVAERLAHKQLADLVALSQMALALESLALADLRVLAVGSPGRDQLTYQGLGQLSSPAGAILAWRERGNGQATRCSMR